MSRLSMVSKCIQHLRSTTGNLITFLVLLLSVQCLQVILCYPDLILLLIEAKGLVSPLFTVNLDLEIPQFPVLVIEVVPYLVLEANKGPVP